MFKSSAQQQQSQQEPQHKAQGNAKQDANCRTCNDFKSWSKQQYRNSTTEKMNANADIPTHREDCPMDKVSLGQSTWGLLHTMAAFYSENPTDTEKRDMRTFFDTLSRVYPCEYCAKDFRTDMEVNPANVNSQADLTLWLCKLHNRVNDKLGKPLFDCTKVNQRWRDGWLDGSCDD